jgi:hypothetical protein
MKLKDIRKGDGNKIPHVLLWTMVSACVQGFLAVMTLTAPSQFQAIGLITVLAVMALYVFTAVFTLFFYKT